MGIKCGRGQDTVILVAVDETLRGPRPIATIPEANSEEKEDVHIVTSRTTYKEIHIDAVMLCGERVCVCVCVRVERIW